MTVGAIVVATAIAIKATETEMLIDFVVRWLLMLDQGRIGDVGRIEMGLSAIGTATAVGAGRERSKHVGTVCLRVERLVECRVVVRVQILAGRPLRHGLIGVHHEATLAVVLVLELLTTWMVSTSMLTWMQNVVRLHHLMEAVIVVELMQLKVVAHFLHQQWIVRLQNGRLLLLLLLLMVLGG